ARSTALTVDLHAGRPVFHAEREGVIPQVIQEDLRRRVPHPYGPRLAKDRDGDVSLGARVDDLWEREARLDVDPVRAEVGGGAIRGIGYGAAAILAIGNLVPVGIAPQKEVLRPLLGEIFLTASAAGEVDGCRRPVGNIVPVVKAEE